MQDYLSLSSSYLPMWSVTERGRHSGGRCCADRGMTSSVLRHDTPLTSPRSRGTQHSTPTSSSINNIYLYSYLVRPTSLISIHSSSSKPIPLAHHPLQKQPNHTTTINMSTTGKLGTGMASDTKTPANAGIGETKPGAFDAKGAVGHAFTGMTLPFKDN